MSRNVFVCFVLLAFFRDVDDVSVEEQRKKNCCSFDDFIRNSLPKSIEKRSQKQDSENTSTIVIDCAHPTIPLKTEVYAKTLYPARRNLVRGIGQFIYVEIGKNYGDIIENYAYKYPDCISRSHCMIEENRQLFAIPCNEVQQEDSVRVLLLLDVQNESNKTNTMEGVVNNEMEAKQVTRNAKEEGVNNEMEVTTNAKEEVVNNEMEAKQVTKNAKEEGVNNEMEVTTNTKQEVVNNEMEAKQVTRNAKEEGVNNEMEAKQAKWNTIGIDGCGNEHEDHFKAAAFAVNVEAFVFEANGCFGEPQTNTLTKNCTFIKGLLEQHCKPIAYTCFNNISLARINAVNLFDITIQKYYAESTKAAPKYEFLKRGDFLELTFHDYESLVSTESGRIFCMSDGYESVLIKKLETKEFVEDGVLKLRLTPTTSGHYWCEVFEKTTHAKISTNQIWIFTDNVYPMEVTLKYDGSEDPTHSEVAYKTYIRDIEKNFHLQQSKRSVIKLVVKVKWMETIRIDEERDIAQYLIHICTKSSTEEHADIHAELEGKFRATFSDLAYVQSFTQLRSSLYCLKARRQNELSSFTWEQTRIGETRESNERCPNGVKLARKCAGDYFNGGFWEAPAACDIDTSTITANLSEILASNQTTPEKIAALSNLTTLTHEFVPIDVYLVSSIIEETNYEEVGVENAALILSNMMRIETGTLKSAQVEFNATDKLLYGYDLIVNAYKVVSVENLTRSDNLVTFIFDCNLTEYSGLALIRISNEYSAINNLTEYSGPALTNNSTEHSGLASINSSTENYLNHNSTDNSGPALINKSTENSGLTSINSFAQNSAIRNSTGNSGLGLINKSTEPLVLPLINNSTVHLINNSTKYLEQLLMQNSTEHLDLPLIKQSLIRISSEYPVPALNQNLYSGLISTNNETFALRKIRRNETLEEVSEINGLEVLVHFSQGLLDHLRAESPKIVINLFLNDALFNAAKDSSVAKNIGVLLDKPGQLPGNITLLFKTDNSFTQTDCAFWNYGYENGSAISGDWLKSAAALKYNDYKRCNYEHVTHFGLLLSDKEIVANTLGLEVITYIGCSLSMLGFFGIFLTASLFRTWRKNRGNAILLHYSFISCVQIILLYASSLVYEANSFSFCVLVGSLLHYTLISQFCWMLIISYLQYKRYVTVFLGSQRYMLLKSFALCYFCPLLPITTLLIFNKETYFKGQGGICYPTGNGLLYAVLLPISLIVTFNLIIFIRIILELFCLKRNKCIDDGNIFLLRLRLVVLMFFMLGVTWGLGFGAEIFESPLFLYAFCSTASLQGFVLFLFFIVFNKNTRFMYAYIWRKYNYI